MTFAVFMMALAMQATPAPRYRILNDCDPSAGVLAEIAKNTPLEVRFDIAQSPTCYSVRAIVNGKQVSGYVLDRNLDAVQTFEKARVTVEREVFSAPLPLPSKPSPASSSSKPAPVNARKEQSKPSRDAAGKEPVRKADVERNARNGTGKVDF